MSDPNASRTAALFDSLAATYDDVGVPFFQPIAEGLVAELEPRVGERWLDIGCGRGAVLVPAATAVGPTGRVVGIDISAAMVEQAQRVIADAGLVNATAEVGDASAPSLAGELFDVVSSSLVLFFLPDPAAALRAWLPVLRPGGRVGITTFGGIDPRWASIDEVFEPYLPPAMKDARTSGAQGPFSSDAGMEGLVSGAGFADVRTVATSVAVHFTDAEQWHAFTWSVGQRAMWLAVPEDERPAVRAEAERRLAEHADADGSITFVQPVRHTLARRPG